MVECGLQDRKVADSKKLERVPLATEPCACHPMASTGFSSLTYTAQLTAYDKKFDNSFQLHSSEDRVHSCLILYPPKILNLLLSLLLLLLLLLLLFNYWTHKTIAELLACESKLVFDALQASQTDGSIKVDK